MPVRHRERHRTEHTGWLRAAVLGANDGILSTASLVLGVAAANGTRSNVLVAGVALPEHSAFGRLPVSPSPLHLVEGAFALHLLLQHSQRRIDVIVAPENLASAAIPSEAKGSTAPA
jgi:VIT family